MSKKIKVGQLTRTVKEILDDYEDDVNGAVKKSVAAASQDAVNELKETSPKRRGKYAKSWNAKTLKETSNELDVVVHNRKYYGLTHLLEHGHAKRNGGRTRAFPHIKPVEEKVTEQLESDIKKGVSNV